GLVRFSKSRDVDGRILHTTVRRNPSGRYFISILVETEVQPLDTTETSIGIDLGITDFAILSDGRKIDNNKFTIKMEKKLKKYQKQNKKHTNLQKKVINQSKDFLHKLSTTKATT